MPDIHIQHVIFTRVEKAYAPQGSSGYQIVYQSPTLSAESVQQIEKYVQCFQTNKQNFQRHQFFRLSQGQAVFTKSVSLISPDPEVIDRNQRDAFLAHALIVNRADFMQVDYDPFVIFGTAEETHLLVEDVELLLSYLHNPPPETLTIAIRTKATYQLDGWSKAEIQNLYLLGASASVLYEQKKSIYMYVADPIEMFRLLSSIFILLPPDEREACSFDTFIDSCTPSPGTFWAAGGARLLTKNGFISMRPSEYRAAPFKSNVVPSMYDTWLSDAIQQAESFQHLNADLSSAQIIANAFKTRSALPKTALAPNALHTFLQSNRQIIDASLYNAIAALLDKQSAGIIAPLIHQYFSLQDSLSIAAQGRCPTHTVALMVYLWLLTEPAEKKKWDDLLEFAERAQDAPLLLLTSLKTPSLPLMGYGKQRRWAIQTLLATQQLPQVLADLLGYPRPDQPHIINHMQLSDEEFETLILALLKEDAEACFQGPCVEHVAKLQHPKIIQNLLKTMNKKKEVPESFIHALQHHPVIQGEK